VPRKTSKRPASGQSILLVDDNPDYLQVTSLLLQREGHHVLTATGGQEALSLLREENVDLLLLDYFMPGMTGEEVVTELRRFNPYVQVILQTGYASEQPPGELLRRLDIQGYYDKSEGPDKLLLWTNVGLKAAHMIQLLSRSRQGLRYILEVTPDLHKVQSLAELLQGILVQLTGLLGAGSSFLAVVPEGGKPKGTSAAAAPEGFVALMEFDTELIIRASTGRFSGQVSVEACLPPEAVRLVHGVVQRGEIRVEDGITIVPLRIRDTTMGVIYMDRPAVLGQDIELLHIFANQAAVAIQNAQLYEMATLDPVSGAYLRRVFEQCMMRELRSAYRAHETLAVMVADVDEMKRINDTAGHLAGDEALTLVGKGLREAVRNSDIVGRYGGDEFAVILPQTSLTGALRSADRILEALKGKVVTGSTGDGDLPVKLSIGIAILQPPEIPVGIIPKAVSQSYFEELAKALIQRADQGLYQAKREGGNQVRDGGALPWPPVPPAGGGGGV
jgi:diguanylate cyclase (GGDEF)-like protein